MRYHISQVGFWVLFFVSAVAVSSCSCSDKECKSSKDCTSGDVCKNGQCVPTTQWTTPTESESRDTDTHSETNSVSSESETATLTDSDSLTDSGDDTESDTTLMGTDCTENWQCNDDSICTVDSCVLGLCVHAAASPLPSGCCLANSQCDDADGCTTDVCNPATLACEYTNIPGEACCVSTADCDDNNSCTIDSCTFDGTCIHVANLTMAGCCEDENDCGSSSCSTLSCVNNQCESAPIVPSPVGCCTVAGDCPVTAGACVVATCNADGQCEYETNPAAAPDCCMSNDDCDDGNLCNVDECTFEYKCVHHAPLTVAPGCCNTDEDCFDSDNCTVDVCTGNTCAIGTPSPLPAGCCANATDCDDGVDCTRDVCTAGHCFSAGDPDLGGTCCFDAGDCDDTNECTVDSCNPFTSQCQHSVFDTDNPPANCCTTSSDCVDTDNPCRIGSCGVSPRYTCSFDTAADDTPCDNGLWCDGPEACQSGVCVTRTGDVPCNGPLGICREGSCDEAQKICTVVAEYDTDSSCDDGFFCNGADVCLAGDCVHTNPPCNEADTDVLGACEQYTCNESSDLCEISGRPNFSSCENNLGCDGANMCIDGVCESASYCGEGNDCAYYVCDEDTAGGTPACTLMLSANGTPCQTPSLGACFGTQNRMCLDGICSIGTDPMCAISGGFCKDYLCVEAWGPGNFPAGGCGEDTDAYGFTELGCDVADTDTVADTATSGVLNTVQFSTALAHNRVSSYGGACAGTFAGAESIYQISLLTGQNITVTLNGVVTTRDTENYNVTLMVLTDACAPSSCVATQSAADNVSINYTAVSDGPVYLVIDTVDRVFATGTLTVTCN